MNRSELVEHLPSAGLLLPVEETLPPVPLEHSRVEGLVVAPLADLQLTQLFRNIHTAPINALYLFPLPEDAAVSDLEVLIGDRVVRGAVHPKGEARRLYDQAARAGQGAALLQSERPNLFSIELANLQPDETIEVRLRFQMTLAFDAGWFSLTIPTVVLPRFVADEQDERVAATPLLPPDAAGHRFDLRLDLAGGPLAALESPSHSITSQEIGGRTRIGLRAGTDIPNRDLVVRFQPAGDAYARNIFCTRRVGEPGTLLLMLAPRDLPEPELVFPRDLIFVFDRSGSMGGESIAQARNALRACLRGLNPADRFNIVTFNNKADLFAATPQPFTQAALDRAEAYIGAIEAGGGTDIRKALVLALDQPRTPDRLQTIVFLTDGAVSNEAQVLRELAGRLNEARVFAFGVGWSVNRFLLAQLAEVGRGSADFLLPGEPIEPAVARFQSRTAEPLLRDLAIDWGGAHVQDAIPERLPDLYAGQPVTLLARFTHSRAEQASVRLSGRSATGLFEQTFEVELPIETSGRDGPLPLLTLVWARARIAALESELRLDPRRRTQLRQTITDLALHYGVLSDYTAMLAVEAPRSDPTGAVASETVVVPIHLPAGTLREAFEPPSTPFDRGGLRMASMDFMPAEPEAAPVVRSPAPAPQSSAPAPVEDADRCAAALRFLARTQSVDGAWAGSLLATVLAAVAFARSGHNDRRGEYRAQLRRTRAWLSQSGAAPAVWALAELDAVDVADRRADTVAARSALEPVGAQSWIAGEAPATVAAWEAALHGGSHQPLVAAQHLGGDSDGAVPVPGGNPLPPDAATLARTAALVLVLTGLTESSTQP
jgi:Ca-activated chloride channel family protein